MSKKQFDMDDVSWSKPKRTEGALIDKGKSDTGLGTRDIPAAQRLSRDWTST